MCCTHSASGLLHRPPPSSTTHKYILIQSNPQHPTPLSPAPIPGPGDTDKPRRGGGGTKKQPFGLGPSWGSGVSVSMVHLGVQSAGWGSTRSGTSGHVHASTDTDYKVHTTTQSCSVSSSRMRLTRASWLVHVPLRIPEASVPATRPARATHGRVVYSIPRILAILEPRSVACPEQLSCLVACCLPMENPRKASSTLKKLETGVREKHSMDGSSVSLCSAHGHGPHACLDLANLGSCHRHIQLPAAFTGSCSHNSGVTRACIYKALPPSSLIPPLFFFFAPVLCHHDSWSRSSTQTIKSEPWLSATST